VLVGADETPGRPVLERYSLRLVDRLLAATVAGTIGAYAVYTVTAHTAWMALTIPFVVFGLARYLVLVHRHELGEEPETVLLSDAPVLVCIAAWAAASALILGEGRERRLDSGEPIVHRLPAGCDQVDEQREVVDACVALGLDVAFDPLQSPDHLVHQAAHLGEMPRARAELVAQADSDGLLDLDRQRRLERVGGRGEPFQRLACPPERRIHRRLIRATGRRIGYPDPRALDSIVHAATIPR
jgi:hypothetical protein